jgi:hypothetical protein
MRLPPNSPRLRGFSPQRQSVTEKKHSKIP